MKIVTAYQLSNSEELIDLFDDDLDLYSEEDQILIDHYAEDQIINLWNEDQY